MKLLVIALLFSAPVFANDSEWKSQSCRYADFRTPPDLVRDTTTFGIDTFLEPYASRDLSLSFESFVGFVTPSLQRNFDRIVTLWAAKRKTEWATEISEKDGGVIHGIEDRNHDSGFPFYLYLGFVDGENTFAVHVRFSNLDQLDEIELLLKSIKFKSK